MNNEQENRLGSYRTTAQVRADNAAIFRSVPALATQHSNLRDSINLADGLAVLQGTNTTGITEAKKEFLRQMKLYAFRVGGALKSYASDTNNLPLKARAHVVDSYFTKARDDERDDIAQALYDAAQENIAALAPSGVTEATMTAFQTRIDAYRLSIAGPSVARSNKKSQTELLDTELKRANMICKERLDGLMEQFRESNPDFYAAYHAARNIIDAGHRKKTPATPPQP